MATYSVRVHSGPELLGQERDARILALDVHRDSALVGRVTVIVTGAELGKLGDDADDPRLWPAVARWGSEEYERQLRKGRAIADATMQVTAESLEQWLREPSARVPRTGLTSVVH